MGGRLWRRLRAHGAEEERLGAAPAAPRPARGPVDAARDASDLDGLAARLIADYGTGPLAPDPQHIIPQDTDTALLDEIDRLRRELADMPMVLRDFGTKADRLARLEARAVAQGLVPPPTPREVALHLREDRPWVVEVDTPDATPAEIAYTLYGLPIGPLMARESSVAMQTFNTLAEQLGVPGNLPEDGGFLIFQGALRPAYAAEFHAKMGALFERDVERTTSILLDDAIWFDDRERLYDIFIWWSLRKGLKAPSGRSYFDEYLDQLDRGRLSTSIGFTSFNKRSYLEELYAILGMGQDRSGEVTGVIGQSSETHGSYVPPWRVAEEGYAPREVADAGFVKRAAAEILDRMAGRTNDDDSRAIRTALEDLPNRETIAVLHEVMNHYEDELMPYIGRFGEPTRDHMLFNLFEDLEDEDARGLADNLADRGLISKDMADALAAGRGLMGKLLPVTTFIGSEMSGIFQDRYEESGDWSDAALGGLFGLWTPETAGETLGLITVARFAPGLAGLLSKAPSVVQGVALGTGAVLTAQNIERNGRAVLTGEGENGPLNESQRVTRGLYLFADLAFLANGFRKRPHGGASQQTGLAKPDALAHGASLGSRVPRLPGEGAYAVRGVDAEGNVLVFARSATGETLNMRMNMVTGEGTVQVGRSAPLRIRDFKIETPRDLMPELTAGRPLALSGEGAPGPLALPGGPVRHALPAGPAAPLALPPAHAGDGIDDILRGLELSETGGFVASGIGFRDLFFYNQQPTARRTILRERARLNTSGARFGAMTKAPQGAALHPDPVLQAAHVAPQAALTGTVDTRRLITRLMPSGIGHQHTVFDAHWQSAFAAIRAQTGRTTTTAAEVYAVVSDAMLHSGAFAPEEAETLRLMLSEELFGRLGLSADAVLRMPGQGP